MPNLTNRLGTVRVESTHVALQKQLLAFVVCVQESALQFACATLTVAQLLLARAHCLKRTLSG